MDTVPRACLPSIRFRSIVRDALHVTVIVSSVLFLVPIFSWDSSFSLGKGAVVNLGPMRIHSSIYLEKHKHNSK